MPGKIVSQVLTVEYDLDMLKEIISSDLQVPPHQLSVRFLMGYPEESDDLPGYSRPEVKGLEVLVDKFKV